MKFSALATMAAGVTMFLSHGATAAQIYDFRDLALAASGNTATEYKVSGDAQVVIVDNQTAGEDEVAAVLAAHPDMARDIATLRTITKVVQTDADTWDFYATDDIKLTLMTDQDGALAVQASDGDFVAKSIDTVMTGQQGSEALSAFAFDFESCEEALPPIPQPNADQGQVTPTCTNVTLTLPVQVLPATEQPMPQQPAPTEPQPQPPVQQPPLQPDPLPGQGHS